MRVYGNSLQPSIFDAFAKDDARLTAEEFKRDLGLNLLGDAPGAGHTKFMQLAATINGLRDTGGVPGRFTIDERTNFVPVAVGSSERDVDLAD
ncbi:hypothetical protein ACIBQ0_30065 [Nocardia nova]|uniref:hypothetical protein n=1 Tax=Nocardia nova TaxID=37330 RepID=UPI0037AE9366